MSGIFTTLSSELNIGAVEPRLQASVLSNVSKTIKLFCVKCEQAAKADSDASQVIGNNSKIDSYHKKTHILAPPPPPLHLKFSSLSPSMHVRPVVNCFWFFFFNFSVLPYFR